jgi:4-amino-4-deoxychorismate lyase
MYLEKDPSGGWSFGRRANRAAFFGDGIFETMVFTNGRIRFGNHHLARLNSGLRVLQLASKGIPTLKDLEKSLVITLGKEENWRVRWNIFRAGLGKYTPSTEGIRETLYIQPFQSAPLIKKTSALSKTVKLFPTPWANCKTLNALPYVMVNLERASLGVDEILLTDGDGYLSEAGAANLFWKKGDSFYTPSLTHNCIAGVGRAALIAHLKKKNIPLHEVSQKVDSLMEADQVFTTNVTGVSFISSFEDTVFDPTPIPVVRQVFSF